MDLTQSQITQHYDIDKKFDELGGHGQTYSMGYYDIHTKDQHEAGHNMATYHGELLELRPGDRGVDLGSGTGYVGHIFNEEFGADMDSYTLSKFQNEYAQKQYGREGNRYHQGDIYEINKTFMKGHASGCAVHQEGIYDKYYENAFRLIEPGGIFLDKEMSATRIITDEECARIIETFERGEYISVTQRYRLARKAGFKVEIINIPIRHYITTLLDWIRCYEENREEMWKIDKERWQLNYRTYSIDFMELLHDGAFTMDILVCQRP